MQLQMTHFLKDSLKRKLDECVSEQTTKKELGKIYKWKFTPPFPHVLKGCCYIGQTLQDFHARTKKHKTDSLRNSKELGLHYLWKQFPYDDHWEICVIEEKHFDDRISAMQWMDKREIALIEQHGGILKDMDKTLHQTLNLTSGGQGDPRKIYESLQAFSRKRLSRVWPALKLEKCKLNAPLTYDSCQSIHMK